jgi:hypothetical protein
MAEDRTPTRQERRAQQRTIAETPVDEPSLVAIRVALCYPDQAPRVRRELHDELIAAHPVRSGPVEWAHFETADREQLRPVLQTAHHDNPETWNYITLHPGCVLVVAMVPVPVLGAELPA